MLAYRYDRTFEGLLTLLFEVYASKENPDRLLDCDQVAPLFIEHERHIATDPAKADRVWCGLERRIGRRERSMVVYAWCAEEPGTDELLLRVLRRCFDESAAVLRNLADPSVLRLHQLARQTARERHRLVEFVRFQKAADGTFVGTVTPERNALPLALDYFTDRFADQRWLLYDRLRDFGYLHDRGTVREVRFGERNLLGDRLDDRLLAPEEREFESMWKAYFEALAIPERLNPRLQRQMMPRRFWKHLPEMDGNR